MAPINTNNVFIRLQEQSVRERSFLESSFVDNGEIARLNEERVDDVANPILETTLDQRVSGRGRRCSTSPKDSLFMALTVMKHFSTWDKHAADFGFKAPTFEKLIMRVVMTIEPLFSEQLIVCPTMTSLTAASRRFSNFPYALYTVDVKFQPSLRPTGRFAEQKHYFSGKHHMYGYKIEAAVSPDGRCVAMSDAHPGSVHDLTILHTRRELHTTNLTKSACEAAMPDHGELSAEYTATWACLVDMGYIGVDHTLRGIHPKRSPQNVALDVADVERNRRVSSDRVVVESFFGRVCSLWKIYGVIQRTTFALTNFHISLMPVRAEDEVYYALIMARYQGMANEHK
ncbi:hypothetical protein H257_17271 [Aphanomyces astaci]|uniref:DDE Tnp4 domain-containing protein n=1 Tax=Aphanomyces astaci TaxID=112090 RepID=W4FH91_APHAT|nr:hypothetical protein H257_17271 [Aphanomyces astaci]ETV66229.1 hypothetical protein H257_17271 [Aphanomyces astaci]|eukprot:XP_009844298.1 hypothetical protein H257_17271 [Aphanomyces astaci]